MTRIFATQPKRNPVRPLKADESEIKEETLKTTRRYETFRAVSLSSKMWESRCRSRKTKHVRVCEPLPRLVCSASRTICLFKEKLYRRLFKKKEKETY